VSRNVSFKEEVAFRRSRGSHMEIDSEMQEEVVSSPPHPSIVQREPVEPMETVEPVDLVDPVDVPRDIAVKEACMGSLDFAGGKETCNSPRYFKREHATSEVVELCCNHEPHH
jgi:hypothetical protein